MSISSVERGLGRDKIAAGKKQFDKSSVTPVLLTETHDPVLPALRHADMVHHEQVDVDLVSAGPSH